MLSMEQAEADFDTVLTPGSIKTAMKDAGAGSRDLWQVEPHKLRVIEGLNPRINTPGYQAHIRSLADSMKSEGFYQDQALAGYVSVEDGNQVISIYSGHSRLLAVALANSEGAEIVRVPVSVSQAGLSMEDITVALVKGNTGRPLTPYETAIVCKRLVRYNMDTDEIAKRLGFSNQYVCNLLSLMSAHHQIREMVANEVVSATIAIDMLAKYGEKALAKLLEAVEAAKGAGKQRVTNRFVEGAVFKKTVKRSAESMFDTLNKVKADPAFLSLSSEVRTSLEELLAVIEKTKPQAPAEPNDKQADLLDAIESGATTAA